MEVTVVLIAPLSALLTAYRREGRGRAARGGDRARAQGEP